MIKLKINGNNHQIPESYEEMTFKMWVDIVDAKKKKDYDGIISIFTGLSLEEIKGARIEGLEILIRKLAFLQIEPQINETPISLGQFVFPKDITFESTEQYQDTLNEVKRNQELNDIGESNKSLALYAAIYCQKPYDAERAKVLAESFMALPCLEVVAAGSFFMFKSLSLHQNLTMNYLRQGILMKNRLPGLSRLLRRLGFMLHLIRSRVM